MTQTLLPPGASPLEIAAAKACAEIRTIAVPHRTLLSPDRCPEKLLPYLAWAFSVDHWDPRWSVQTKRRVIKAAYFVHKHKGTIGALRRVVEPLGYLIRITEWWQHDGEPGTFRIDIGVQEHGVTPELHAELERLIADAKPLSRHLRGLGVLLETRGTVTVAAGSDSGDILTVYPYTPARITVTARPAAGAGVHLIDEVRIAS